MNVSSIPLRQSLRVGFLLLVLMGTDLLYTSTAQLSSGTSAPTTHEIRSSDVPESAGLTFASLFSTRPTRERVIQFSIALMALALFIMLRK